ncbi:hypothetical protein GCM10011508_24920 [Flavobacterium lutivivi]|nr:hypothetical protein GCM10011508_24920 [Flavobacterium lutivivi]
MNKIVVLVIMSLLFSCGKKREIENIFISKDNEYWDYDDTCQSHGIYFRFNEKGDWDKYNRDIFDGFELFNNDGDLISDARTWSIKNDSIFVWNDEDYKIESYSKEKIVLTYYHYKEKDKKCTVTFTKVIDK